MTKQKSGSLSPNKISDREERRAENSQERLQKQGIGKDEAWQRALKMAAEEVHGGEGGGGAAGGGAKHHTGG